MPLFSGDLQLHFLTYLVYWTGCSHKNKQKTYTLGLPNDGGNTTSTPMYAVFLYVSYMFNKHSYSALISEQTGVLGYTIC